MAIKNYHAQAKHLNGLQVEASARGFRVHLDEPDTSGGENTGMNPVELLLCSLAACETITTILYAEFYGIPIESLWVELEGAMDQDGFSGANPAVRPGFQSIRASFHICSSAPEAQLKQLLTTVGRMCPVGDSVGNGVPLQSAELVLESM